MNTTQRNEVIERIYSAAKTAAKLDDMTKLDLAKLDERTRASVESVSDELHDALRQIATLAKHASELDARIAQLLSNAKAS